MGVLERSPKLRTIRQYLLGESMRMAGKRSIKGHHAPRSRVKTVSRLLCHDVWLATQRGEAIHAIEGKQRVSSPTHVKDLLIGLHSNYAGFQARSGQGFSAAQQTNDPHGLALSGIVQSDTDA